MRGFTRALRLACASYLVLLTGTALLAEGLWWRYGRAPWLLHALRLARGTQALVAGAAVVRRRAG